MDADGQKKAAAEYAVNMVEDGMTVGLGSGSTAEIAVHLLGHRFQKGLQIVGVPTSEQTARLARSYGIPLASLDERSRLDIAIDGADEVDPQLNCIKGHGGQLLWEKIVACASAKFVVIVDDSKRVLKLGQKAAVPVEIIPFGWTTTKIRLEWLNLVCELRGGEKPYKTSSNNYILDCYANGSLELANQQLAQAIKGQTGVVEHGLFLGIATTVVVGKGSGGVDVLQRPTAV
jgi:ribose 5-phosphate isomerase A